MSKRLVIAYIQKRRRGGEEMQNELKACPFCGSEATTHFLNEAWLVECNNSKCIGAKISCGYRRKEDAVEAWNKRAREEGFNLAIKRIEELKSNVGYDGLVYKRYADEKIDDAIAIIKQVAENHE